MKCVLGCLKYDPTGGFQVAELSINGLFKSLF